MNFFTKSILFVIALGASSVAIADEPYSDFETLVSHKMSLEGATFEDNSIAATVVILKDKTAKITLSEFNFQNPFSSVNSSDIETTIGDHAFQAVLLLVQGLSTEETVTTHSEFVCHVMPHPLLYTPLEMARDYDPETKTFKTQKRTVQSSRGCWLSTKVNFKESYAQSRAEVLKGMLKMIAAQAADQQ